MKLFIEHNQSIIHSFPHYFSSHQTQQYCLSERLFMKALVSVSSVSRSLSTRLGPCDTSRRHLWSCTGMQFLKEPPMLPVVATAVSPWVMRRCYYNTSFAPPIAIHFIYTCIHVDECYQ